MTRPWRGSRAGQSAARRPRGLWLERQINDPYVARAKREGFRSRAAYKLAEIDDKYHLLKPGARVVDLGAAPGGWSEIAARRVGASGPRDRARHSRHEADRRRRIPATRFSRRNGAGAPQGAARWQSSRRTERPMSCSPTWRPTPPATGRPITCASWRSPRPRRSSRAKCSPRRRVPLQGAARRHRSGAARRAQARFRHRQARQAAGEPHRFGRALSAGARVSGYCGSVGPEQNYLTVQSIGCGFAAIRFIRISRIAYNALA